ncbi:hypothetical protein [Pseudooceanicola spongiae]|uniref:Uncharacterized protein n=1 Tax=Pseudooceanicola spongiae TaxID=2613965 RepID=A0A7L9WRP8_9RHOB|nr:hypothetical protein F3W81_17820 [Pseudooceanicola spongiae]
MILSDTSNATQRSARGPSGPHKEPTGRHRKFPTWPPARRITTAAILLTDCNFKTRPPQWEVERTGGTLHGGGKIESIDWQGDYSDQARGGACVVPPMIRSTAWAKRTCA